MATAPRDSEAALLLSDEGAPVVEVYDRTWWRVVHAVGFATGGLTFIVGTGLFWLPAQTVAVENWTAALYILGSLGFLSVDLLEIVTFTQCPLRFNIALSATGSTLYVIGSAGFLPAVTAKTLAWGIWGFILGSAIIGCSQIWKLLRFATPPPPAEDPKRGQWPSLATLFSSKDVFTAAGVEAGACAGAWFFFAGTILYAYPAYQAGPLLNWVLCLWMVGSVAFTVGAAFLAYRHFVMRVT